MNPKIYILSRPSLEVGSINEFLIQNQLTWRKTTNASLPENLVEVAGRICYMSFGLKQSPKTNEEYIEHLINMGHESVLEHVNWTFLITGVSRAFSHQLVRHRAGFSFSQLSQQYHNESEAEYVKPESIEKESELDFIWNKAMKMAKSSYKEILGFLEQHEKNFAGEINKKEIKRAIQSAARSVLPNAIETKIVMTANARALRHFFHVRGGIPGDEEMRKVCSELLRILKKDSPAVFFDFDLEELSDGSPIVKKKSMSLAIEK